MTIRFALPLLAALTSTAAFAEAPKTTAAAFVSAAGASDLYEKTSSQLVLQSTKNAKVKSFAQMMVSDHSKTTADVTAAAKASGLKPMPPKLMPKQAAMIAELKKAPVATRDKVYVDQQVKAHEEALALHQGYASAGDKPALKKVAASAVPIVQTHLTEVRGLASAM